MYNWGAAGVPGALLPFRAGDTLSEMPPPGHPSALPHGVHDMIDAATLVNKWAERTGSQSAINAYKDGVSRVTEAPTVKAAAKLDKYMAGVQAAYDSGKTRDSLLNSPLELYRNNALNVGAARIATGVKKGQQKMTAFAQAFVPFLQSAQAANAQMPDTTLEDRIAKSADMQRRLAQFKRPAGNRYS